MTSAGRGREWDPAWDLEWDLEWDDVVDVICVGSGPGVLAYAIVCATVEFDVVLAHQMDPVFLFPQSLDSQDPGPAQAPRRGNRPEIFRDLFPIRLPSNPMCFRNRCTVDF